MWRRPPAGLGLHQARPSSRIEDENATRADLLIEVRDAHRLQERILNDLADELHDTVLADSKAIEIQLYALAQQSVQGQLDQMALHTTLNSLHAQSLAVQRSLRQIVEGAKPVDFAHEPLSAALLRMTQQLNAVSPHTSYHCDLLGSLDTCPGVLNQELYWIIRAAVNNVRDHAQATHCTIRLMLTPASIELVIDDDGIGVQAPPTSGTIEIARRHLGLTSIRTRAARLGGTLQFEQREPGTRLRLSIPIETGR